MSLALCSLASGSSGNCYLIKSNNTALLVDAGISAKQISERLGALGIGVFDINGILITHEHTDHTKGLHVLLKTGNAKLYLNESTFSGMNEEVDSSRLNFFNTGESFSIGDIRISSFHNSHDALDPVGFSFESEGCRAALVTDTGVVTDEAFENMKNASLLVLESNHDENVLKMGRYPWFLKKRILGEHGHLSNDAAAEILLRLYKEGFWKSMDEETGEFLSHQVLLAHLSAENNFPEMALQTVSNILEAEGITVGRSVKLFTLSRTAASPLFEI